jgi:hypothetical protein
LFATAAIDQKEERQASRAENKLFTLLLTAALAGELNERQLLATVGQREKIEQRTSQKFYRLKGQGKIGSCTVVGLWQSKQTSQALAAANQ